MNTLFVGRVKQIEGQWWAEDEIEIDNDLPNKINFQGRPSVDN